METKIYRGVVYEEDYGKKYDALFIGQYDEPIAEIFVEELQSKQVTVRYWTSDNEKDDGELKLGALKNILGAVDADYSDRYSDYSGYLWTDEELNVGGHDLLEEIRSFKGKYMLIEVDVHCA